MKFIEMTGSILADIIKDDEVQPIDLKAAGVEDQTIVRVNEQGDIEVRREKCWDVIGGLLGNYSERIRKTTGLEWV